MKTTIALLAVLGLAALFALGGCGQSEDSGPRREPPTQTYTPPGADLAPPPSEEGDNPPPPPGG